MSRVQWIITAALTGLLTTMLWAVPVAPASAAPGTPPGLQENPGRGVVLDDLRKSPKCETGFEIADEHADGAVHDHGCTHGPDQPPKGVDPKKRVPTLVDADTTTTGGTASATTAVPCYGDGQSGTRVEAIYAYPSGSASRQATVLPSIRAWAGEVDRVFNASAAKTGGVRHVKFVTDSSCSLVVRNVALSASGIATVGGMITDLNKAGYNRSDRKYLVWVDTNIYCGVAQIMPDDSPLQGNRNNGSGGAMFARVDSGCWGVPGRSVEAHELMHTLGGVQTTATHSTPANHCYDGADLMCYDDGTGVLTQSVCDPSQGNLFDCRQDDYYSTAPAPGSYLATHWNAANSAWLTSAQPVAGLAGWTDWASRGAPASGVMSGVDATSWGSGRIDMVARGGDNAVWHRAFSSGAWSGWQSLGGYGLNDPSIVSWGPGRLDAFVRGGDNQLWHKWYTGTWSGWGPLGAPPGGLVNSIDVTSWAPGRIDIVTRGADNAVWHKWWDNGWSGWESLHGYTTADPSNVSWGPGRLDVFARAGDNQLWRRFWQNGWSAWQPVGAPAGGMTSGVDADSGASGRIDVAVRGSGNAVFQATFVNGAWQPWVALGGVTTSDPAIVSWGSPRVDVLVRGSDNALWQRSRN